MCVPVPHSFLGFVIALLTWFLGSLYVLNKLSLLAVHYWSYCQFCFIPHHFHFGIPRLWFCKKETYKFCDFYVISVPPLPPLCLILPAVLSSSLNPFFCVLCLGRLSLHKDYFFKIPHFNLVLWEFCFCIHIFYLSKIYLALTETQMHIFTQKSLSLFLHHSNG